MARTGKPQPPPPLPAWMTDFSEADRSAQSPFQLGNANSDQFAVGGWGTQNRPDEQYSGDYWTSTRNLPNRGTDAGQIASGNPLNSVALQEALDPGKGHLGPIAPSQPSTTMIGDRGIAGYGTPPTGRDRVGRTIRGAFRGYDTGSTLGNVGVNVAANAVPGGGIANRVAGAVQGARDTRPVFTPTRGKTPTSTVTNALNQGEGFYPLQREVGVQGGGPAYWGPKEVTDGKDYNQDGVIGGGEGFGWAPGGPQDPGFAANPIEGRPPAAAVEQPSPTEQALKDILSGGQTYQTDGAGGRVGVAGVGSGYDFTGFDFAQDPSNRDVGKSAKYAFSHLASQAAAQGAPPPRTKAEAEQWFLTYIKPGMDELGFTVHKVVGDKAFISAPEHPQGAWVDFQVNSGGQGAMPLAWQAELGGAGMEADPEALFAVLGGGGGGDFGMDRGEGSGLLDSGNSSLNSFASKLVENLLAGVALEDTLEMDRKRTRGLSPESLRTVGF